MRKKNRNLRSSGGDEGGITSGLSSRHPFSIPKRNGFVSVGESCILKTNHFKPSTYCDNIYRYEVRSCPWKLVISYEVLLITTIFHL